MSATKPWKKNLGNYRFNQVAISDDGSVLVGGTYFWASATNTGPETHKIGVYAYSASGNQLLADEFNATAGKSSEGGPYSIAVSDDGKYLVTGGQIDLNQAFLYAYDLATGEKVDLLDSIPAPAKPVNFVAISGKTAGKYVVAAGADQLYVSVGKGSDWTTTAVPTGLVYEVAISKDGTFIVAAIKGGSVVLVFNPGATGASMVASNAYQLTNSYAQMVAIAADGSGFAVAQTPDPTTNGTGTALYFPTGAVFPSKTLTPAWSTVLTGCSSCRWIDISKDGTMIAAVGNVKVSTTQNQGTLFLFQKQGNSYVQKYASGPGLIARSPNSVSIDNTGLNIVVADGYTSDPQSAFTFFTPNTPGDPTTLAAVWSYYDMKMNRTAAISKNGNAIVGGGNDGNLYYFPVP